MSAMPAGRGHGPLHGVAVVELAGLGPAPHGAGLLSDLGASVVRLDRPADVPARPPQSVPAGVLSRGRRSIAIDLKTAAGIELAGDLIGRADVLIDPFRPGVAERLGIGPTPMCERNERLIYARMTDAPPPVPLNVVADFGGGGMLLAFGVAAALFERERSGRGQVLDVAMVDGVASLLASVFELHAGGQFAAERHAHWLQGAAPWYRAYRTADDRFISVGALEPKFYAELLEALGLDPHDWPQWDESAWGELTVRIAAIFASRPLAEWREALADHDACIAPALELGELLDDPQLAARATYVLADGAVQPAPAPRFQRTPGSIAGPPPWPGQHTAQVLGELGVERSRIGELLAEGVVGTA